MERITITIDGKVHEMRQADGRAWRITAEYMDGDFRLNNPALVEDSAKYIAEFFDGVTAEEVMKMPLSEILPAAMKIRDNIFLSLSSKIAAIEKNSEADKAQEQ